MSRFGGIVSRLTSPELPNSINNWINLLSFFHEHKDDLDIEELNTMANKSELIRIEWNETHPDHISEQEVNPNIFTYVDCLRITLYDKSE